MVLYSVMIAGVLVSCAGESSPHDSFGDGEGPRENIVHIVLVKMYSYINMYSFAVNLYLF